MKSGSIHLLKRTTNIGEHALLPFPTELCMGNSLTRSRSRRTSVWFEQDKDAITLWINSLTSHEIGNLLEGLVKRCSIDQFAFLWTTLESVPHKEFLYHLKRLFPSTSFPAISTPISRELKEKFDRSGRQENKLLYRAHSTLLHTDITSSLSSQLLNPQTIPLPNIHTCTCTRPSTAPEYISQKELPGSRLITSGRRHMTVTLSRTTTISPTSCVTTPLKSVTTRHHSFISPIISPIQEKISLVNATMNFLNWFTSLEKDWQQKEVLQLIVWSLEERELFYLSTLIISCQYRDFIADLSENIVRKILSYVPGKDILSSCRVSRNWNEKCSCNVLWKIKCYQTSLGVPYPLPSLTWKQIYIDDIKLRRNWRLGHSVKYTLTGHTHRVLCVKVKKGEGIMASGSSDQTIKVWSLKDGRLLTTIYTHSKNIWCLCFYGLNFIISGSGDGSVKIWNYKTGTCERSLQGHTGTVWSVARKHDVLISGAHDKTAILWNIRHCQYMTHLTGHNGAIFSVDLNDTATEAYTASGDKTIRVWNVGDGQCIRSISVSKHQPVMSIHFSDGLLACSAGTIVSLWNITDGEKLKDFKGHEGRVESLHLITNGSNSDTIISGGRDGIVKYWNINSGRCIRTLLTHSAPTMINDVHRDSMYLVIGRDNYTVQVLSFYPGAKIPVSTGSKRLEISIVPGIRISTAIEHRRNNGWKRSNDSRRIKSSKL